MRFFPLRRARRSPTYSAWQRSRTTGPLHGRSRVHTSTPTNRHRHAKRHAHKHTRACAHATAHADRDFSFVKTDSKVSVDWDSDNDDGAQRAHAQTDMRVCALGFAHRPPSRTRAGARAGWSVDSLDNDSGDELEVTQKVHALMRVRLRRGLFCVHPVRRAVAP